MSHSSDPSSRLAAFALASPALRARLGDHASAFKQLWVTGAFDVGARAIAVVGARDHTAEARRFAIDCATTLARSGIVVVSGGAAGIDGIAHEAAMAAGGVTWIVSPAGAGRVYPPAHAALFEQVVARGGAIITATPPGLENPRGMFHQRNRLLVALSNAIVVVQAGARSGTLDTAMRARAMHKPLFVAGVAPWAQECFEGSAQMLDAGANALVSLAGLPQRAGIEGCGDVSPQLALLQSSDATTLSSTEIAVAQALSGTPAHLDEVVAKSHLPVHVVATALLTLALENVVVEGPSGFFRRANPR